jgi:hypothetical protein
LFFKHSRAHWRQHLLLAASTAIFVWAIGTMCYSKTILSGEFYYHILPVANRQPDYSSTCAQGITAGKEIIRFNLIFPSNYLPKSTFYITFAKNNIIDMLGVISPREPITSEFSNKIREALWRATTGNLNEAEKQNCRRIRQIRKQWKAKWEWK